MLLNPEYMSAVMPDVIVIQSLDDLPGSENLVAFTYRITDRLTGKLYIGTKSLHNKTKKKATVKEKAAALALNPKSRISIMRGKKDSGWLQYWGSNIQLQEDVALNGGRRYVREIIDLCCSRKYACFSELEQMFRHNVLRMSESQCYNGNMLSKFYRKDTLNCPEDNE